MEKNTELNSSTVTYVLFISAVIVLLLLLLNRSVVVIFGTKQNATQEKWRQRTNVII